MRFASLGVLLLAGCVSAEAPSAGPPRVIVGLAPSVDPYAMTFVKGPLDPRVERADRVPEWSDAKHVRELDRFVVWDRRNDRVRRPSDLIRFGPTGIALRGTREQNAVLRRFLRDRAKHAKTQVYLALSFLTIDPERQPELDGFQSLPSGALWGTVDAKRLEGVDEWKVDQSPSLFTLDALRALIRVGEYSPSSVCYDRIPALGVAFAGFSLDAAPALSADGRLVLWVDAVESAWAEVFAVPTGRGLERLPATTRRGAFQGRFVLRKGEALLIVKNTPAGLRGLTVRWERVRPTTSR